MEIWDAVLNLQLRQNKDMELVGVFTRRNPEDVKLLNGNMPVHMMDDIQIYGGNRCTYSLRRIEK